MGKASSKQQIINKKAIQYLNLLDLCVRFETIALLDNLSDNEANVFIGCCNPDMADYFVQEDIKKLNLDIDVNVRFIVLVKMIRRDLVFDRMILREIKKETK